MISWMGQSREDNIRMGAAAKLHLSPDLMLYEQMLLDFLILAWSTDNSPKIWNCWRKSKVHTWHREPDVSRRRVTDLAPLTAVSAWSDSRGQLAERLCGAEWLPWLPRLLTTHLCRCVPDLTRLRWRSWQAVYLLTIRRDFKVLDTRPQSQQTQRAHLWWLISITATHVVQKAQRRQDFFRKRKEGTKLPIKRRSLASECSGRASSWLHWLPVQVRTDFKVLLITFKAHLGLLHSRNRYEP